MKPIILKIVSLLVFLMFLTLLAGAIYYATSHKKNENEKPLEYRTENDDLAALLEKSGNLAAENNEVTEAADHTVSGNGIGADSEETKSLETEKKLPIPLYLTDIYAERDDTAVFRCYDSEAEAYAWEYYDMSFNAWKKADIENIQNYEDELGREVSKYEIKADENMNGIIVRCTIHFKDPDREDEIQEASLFILPGRIKKISLEEKITVDANYYLSTRELPVKVTYADGTDEIITGLNHLYFVLSEEKKDQSVSISGNRVETTTLIMTECDYLYTGMKEQEQLVRYHPDMTEIVETKAVIKGEDTIAPEIMEVTVSPYEVSNIDGPVTLSIKIKAEDNVTPYPNLEYAFLYSDEEPEEDDWIKKSSFETDITRNGIYTAYVRDSSGNIAHMEKEIITVDMKAPVIKSISLANETNWCRSNTIRVSAYDASNILYCFDNQAGNSSGWITYNEYTVDTNGIWIIRVKDAAGNISDTEEIEISNIDKKAPIIHNISIK